MNIKTKISRAVTAIAQAFPKHQRSKTIEDRRIVILEQIETGITIRVSPEKNGKKVRVVVALHGITQRQFPELRDGTIDTDAIVLYVKALQVTSKSTDGDRERSTKRVEQMGKAISGKSNARTLYHVAYHGTAPVIVATTTLSNVEQFRQFHKVVDRLEASK